MSRSRVVSYVLFCVGPVFLTDSAWELLFGEQIVFARNRHQTEPVVKEKVKELLTQLNAVSFKVREQATKKIIKEGKLSIQPMVTFLNSPHLELETQKRIFYCFHQIVQSQHAVDRKRALTGLNQVLRFAPPQPAREAFKLLLQIWKAEAPGSFTAARFIVDSIIHHEAQESGWRSLFLEEAFPILNSWKTVDDQSQIQPLVVFLKTLPTRQEIAFPQATTNQALSLLKLMPQLVTLNLRGTNIHETGLVQLKQLSQLKDLDLGQTKINDSGIKYLKHFQKLEILNLWGTQVSDQGLAQLTEFKTLKTLYLGGTQVSPTGIKRFQKKCPDCQIIIW